MGQFSVVIYTRPGSCMDAPCRASVVGVAPACDRMRSCIRPVVRSEDRWPVWRCAGLVQNTSAGSKPYDSECFSKPGSDRSLCPYYSSNFSHARRTRDCSCDLLIRPRQPPDSCNPRLWSALPIRLAPSCWPRRWQRAFAAYAPACGTATIPLAALCEKPSARRSSRP